MEARFAARGRAGFNQGLTAQAIDCAAMYKAVFRNSKIALLFAAMTLFSAVTMVGTSEDGGTLAHLKTMMGDVRSHAEAEAAAAQARANMPESAAPVFGEYAPEPAPAPPPPPAPAADAAGAPVVASPATPAGPMEAKGIAPLGTAPVPTLPVETGIQPVTGISPQPQ